MAAELYETEQPEAAHPILPPESRALAKLPPSPMELIASAVDKGFDADQLGKLMDILERREKAEAEKAYWDAMAKCQKEMPAILKDKENRFLNTRYSSFESLNKTIRPIYTAHGFSLTFTQEPGAREGFVRLLCDVGHERGHVRRHQGEYPLDGTGSQGGKSGMNAVQAVGSTHSYAKRYLCKDIFNLAEANEDDDGQAELTLTKDHIGEINGMLEDCRKIGKPIDFNKFLAWLNVTSLNEVPQAEFLKIVRYLNGKRALK